MKVFIWKRVENATDNHHSGGGVVIIAEDEKKAKELFLETRKKESGNPVIRGIETEPDHVYELAELNNSFIRYGEKVLIFRDAGCC